MATLAIGTSGAVNAALLAVRILALTRPELKTALAERRDQQAQRVLGEKLP